MRISRLISITLCMWPLLACQSVLPTSHNTQATAYPSIDGVAPVEIQSLPATAYPEPGLPNVDGNQSALVIPTIPALQPTAAPQLMQTLSNGADISQPGTYTVQVMTLDTPYMVRAKTDTNQVDVALAGIMVGDLGNPTCNAKVRERLDLLTGNPVATYTLQVYQSDPAHAGAVIAKVTRHDNIDIALDLLATGNATLASNPPQGFEQYMMIRDAARSDLLGMWNEGECKFTAMFLQGQDA